MTPSTQLADLLLNLADAGAEVAAHPTDPDRLRYRPAVLPAHLMEGLRMYRRAILSLLKDGYDPGPEEDEPAYVLLERLGVADDLGMETHPGSTAWLVAVGESMAVRCRMATNGVQCDDGSDGKGDREGGQGESADALRNRQGGRRESVTDFSAVKW